VSDAACHSSVADLKRVFARTRVAYEAGGTLVFGSGCTFANSSALFGLVE
jgi:hypothetical protein